ncbi:MAG: ABC transporter permease [Planctomycetes bacterium]|nr:ABC transporter permease [Planctomycetota bacterium]
MKPFAGAGDALTLSWRIFRRTIAAKYRKSFLGYFWMVAPALFITGGVTLASQAGVVVPSAGALPQGVSVFLGTLLWQVFAEAIEIPHQAFEGARSYLTRVHFSRAAIVLSQLYESLITTAVRLIAALAFVAVSCGLDPSGMLLVPIAFYGAVLLGLGIGALLMPFLQLFADLQQTVKLLLGYGLFLTPAMYEPQGDSAFATIVRCNPVSPLMEAARQAAAGQALAQPVLFATMLGAGVLLTVAGLLLVRAVAPILIERMLLGGR